MRSIAFLIAACLLISTAQATTFYTENFDSGIGSEWSSSNTSTIDGSLALGRFAGNSAVTLNLSSISAYSELTVTLDFWTTGSTDGNGVPFPNGGTPGAGPDIWRMKADGATLIESTFSNHRFQNFPDSFASGIQHAPNTGATKVIGGGSGASVLYSLSFTFAHSASNVTFEFSDSNFTDEQWSLDNITVSTGAVPEPSSIALLLLGLSALFIRKRK